jgi:hypothetical protein
MKNKKPLLLMVFGLLVFSACSGSDELAAGVADAPQPTSTTIAAVQVTAEPTPPPEIDPNLSGTDLLVAVEARWMCDVQRYAFSDMNAMDEALDERLAEHGIERTDYDTFKIEMEDRIDLREGVSAEYELYCGEG